jgi:hypothetical protein
LPEDVAVKAQLSYAQPGALSSEISRPSATAGDARVEQAMLEEIGLLRRIKKTTFSSQLFSGAEARYRDFFFDERVIFPIHSLEGDVVGFAGRAVKQGRKDAPKYLYSPGLAKSSILYRANAAVDVLKTKAASGRRREIYICEGLVDALRLESLGFAAVSILGAQASKEQVKQLLQIANEVEPAGDLLVHIFLDRDKAGIRGSAKLAVALAEAGLDADFIWPKNTRLEELGVPLHAQKDPDAMVSVLGSSWNEEFVRESVHPTALPVIAEKLQAIHSLDDVLDDEVWNSISLGVRYRAAIALTKSESEAEFLLSVGARRKRIYEYAWFADIQKLRTNLDKRVLEKEGYSAEFIADEASRMNVARVLAKSGADRGEVPTDEAAWRRLEAGATAFNVGLRERLQESTFEPLEPFDAVFVARDFDKQEPRLKAMPCVEDLVLQQYMLAETLTERFDVVKEADCFSISIPAVRFYRGRNQTLTTAENGLPGANEQTISFAYQIDMDVLEGRSKASNQGMFRPYIECWREFVESLRATANRFDEVYAVRLDLKRYYDRLYKSTVRDALRVPFSEAIERLKRSGREAEFAPSFTMGRQNISDSVVDWFCEQSFGYQYYHPETGRITGSEPAMGIPQGPILSAWLATVALFPLDSELRKVLQKFNSDSGQVHAGYARYVDDIFLIADSPQILEEMRAAVEDACARLRLDAIPKGELAPRMKPEEFNELLTEGKALIGSGPAREIGLLDLGDGEAGFETWHDSLQRASSLVLLSDRRLYEADTDAIKRQVFTAITAHDLRPAELSKASRWIWYAVAKEDHETARAAWHSYWVIWTDVTERLARRMKVDLCPWHDPSLYALDGLERVLRSVSTYDRNLSLAADDMRKRAVAALSRLVLQDGFFAEFASPQAVAPRGAGRGVHKLRRMFVQRSVCVRWIARKLQKTLIAKSLAEELGGQLGLASNEMAASLTRALLTDADGASFAIDIRANVGSRLDYSSPLRSLFLWLHEAIVLLGRSGDVQQDPLQSIRGRLNAPALSDGQAKASKFFGLLNLWKPDLAEHELIMLELRLDALAALLAVCNVDALIHCVRRRPHLLKDVGDPVPALPGIPLDHLVLKKANASGRQLEAVTQIFPEGGQPITTDYRVASANDVVLVSPSWVEVPLPVDTQLLAARRTRWQGDSSAIRDKQPHRVETFGFQDLQWAADCFEALARVNYDLERDVEGEGAGEVMEFVPAWPYIAASQWVEDFGGDTPKFSLFGPIVPRTHLANFAFARDGNGRLRAHEVSLADAHLWRIGYAVTDALGMVDDIERFQALEQDGRTVNVNTAQYVLSRLLGRLRGEGRPPSAGLPHPIRPHLTGSTNRALQLLRKFPSNGSASDEVQFLLAVEAETAAMRLHGDGHSDCSRPGTLTSMMAGLAPAVFHRLTARQLEALPSLAVVGRASGPERRVVAAWCLLDRRLGALETCLAAGIPEASSCAWIALRRSVRVAAIAAWTRALVFEIYIAGDGRPSDAIQVPSEWEIDDPVLALDTPAVSIGSTFKDALAPKGRLAIAAKITPIGWLVLLTSQLNLYGTDTTTAAMPEERAAVLRGGMTQLARQLAIACADEDLVDDKWPFDACSSIDSVFDDESFSSARALLEGLQEALGYKISNCRAYAWGLPPQSKSFTDEGGRQWPLLRGLVDQVGRDRHVELEDGADGRRVWTQTTNRDGKLIGVSVLGETFATTAGTQATATVFDAEVLRPTPTEGGLDRKDRENVAAPADANNAGHVAVAAQDDGHRVGDGDEQTAEDKKDAEVQAPDDANVRPKPPETDQGRANTSPQDFFKRLREMQEREWRTRRTAKNAGHVRFAVFQFRIDDSYYHPIVDAGFPDVVDRAMCNQVDIDSACSAALADMARERAGEPPLPGAASSAQRAKASLSKKASEDQWDRSDLLPSWNEHRRRRLLGEAIRACHVFGVDVLVLPEYSIRPDTVEWLRKRLTELPDAKLSIVAGTYRLHGAPADIHFTKSFAKIFGVADAQKVFATGGASMEKSAYITLLQPIRDVPGAVGVFSRRKKFHSMAMGEFINPSEEPWAPLADLEGLVSQVDVARKDAGLPPIDAKGVTRLAKQIRPVERMAELICSELFASTHPVNHTTIKSEYRALRHRFGYDPGESKADEVFAEINNLTTALQLDGRVDRRTILVVPACTTRSADYWIYGQSALLAAGLTTVFCAAVLADPKTGLKGGGSCVIAKSSWSLARDIPAHISVASPYSGWSRGIYYNRPEDVLSRKEQAVVIVDIDPIYMNEGKPRPQALPVPIQLVAHLPVAEMVDDQLLKAAYTPLNGGFRAAAMPTKKVRQALHAQDINEVADVFKPVGAYLATVGPARLVDAKAQLSNSRLLAEAAGAMSGFFSEPTGWSDRLACWSRNWREMPFYGPPPALIDWLPVDLSPENGGLASIFVPPWGGDFGGK